jgi:hypothetical protein
MLSAKMGSRDLERVSCLWAGAMGGANGMRGIGEWGVGMERERRDRVLGQIRKGRE